MSEKPAPSIWSIKPKKKKNLGSPISSADTNSSNVNPRKRGYDALIKSEKNDDAYIKNESEDDDIDPDLEDMFGIGIAAQSNKDEAQKQIEKKNKRALAKALKIEEDANSDQPKKKTRVRPAPTLKSTLTRSESLALQTSTETINIAMRRFSENTQTTVDVTNLRECVQKLPFIPADSITVLSQKTLDALSKLVRAGNALRIPQDIILEAQSLRNKWHRSVFDKAVMRGIASSSTINRDMVRGKIIKRTSAWRLEDNYRHKVEPLVIGHNGLTVGDWWPLQICALRDGAHGETEAGISGNKEYGCISVVMSHGYSKDEDYGDRVLYCGTVGVPVKGTGTSVPSGGTKLLQTSLKNGTPVRLLRSTKSKKHSAYAPSAGIRYDGLYVVTAYEILDEATQMYRFTMDRQPNQPAMRYEGPGVKPNAYDLREWNKLKDMMKGER